MKKIQFLTFAFLFFALSGISQNKNYTIVIHGGAGSVTKDNTTPQKIKEYTKKLQEVLDAAGNIAMPFNTNGMYRAYVKSNGETAVLMFKD